MRIAFITLIASLGLFVWASSAFAHTSSPPPPSPQACIQHHVPRDICVRFRR